MGSRVYLDGRRILDLPMEDNDTGAKTVREYLKELLSQVWGEREGFSGKRPFGNSGWEGELEAALVSAGAVDGVLDEDGYLESVDEQAAYEAINSAIEAL